MAKIYRTTDRIKYKIGEVEISISPLSVHDKTILHTYVTKAQSGDVESLMRASSLAVKFAVKDINGLENSDGTAYELQFENNQLTDECVDDLMNIQESTSMITVCGQLISGIPSQLPKGVSLVEGDKSPNEVKAKK